MRLTHSPILHFLLLGTTMFIASRLFAPDPSAELESKSTRTIEIEAARQAELRNTFLEQMGRAPSEGELRAMLSAEIDEEILFREALSRGLLERDGGVKTRLIQKMLFLEERAVIEDAPALLDRARRLGLHEGDIVVRRILVQKMRLLASTLDADARPKEQDIEAAYKRQAELLREPDRRSITQIFFSTDRRPDSAQADAARVRTELMSSASREVPNTPTIVLGDPFPLGQVFERRSERDLDRSFGARFGREAFATKAGTWSKPIKSAYGFHLVQVDRVENGEIPPLESVREQLGHRLEQERREQQLENLLSDLRTRYDIVLESSASRSPNPPMGSPDTQKEAR